MPRSIVPNLCGIYFVAAVAAAVCFLFLSEEAAAALYAPCVLTAVALLAIHIWIVWPRPQGAIASLHVLLPAVYFAVHFSYQLSVLCGIRHFFDYDYIEAGSHYTTTVLCLSGFLMLLSGLARSYGPATPFHDPYESWALFNEDRLNRAATWIVGTCMLVMCGLAVAADFRSLLYMPYAHPDSMGVVGRLYDTVQKVFMIALLVSLSTVRRGLGFSAYAVPAVCAGVWFIFWSLVGLRGQTQVFILGLLIAWSLRIRPLSRKTIALACSAALLSWIVIGEARHRTSHAGGGLANMLAVEAVANIVTQAGQVVTTVDRALGIHPENEPYQLGRSYLASLIFAFPNLGTGSRVQLEGYAQWMSDYYGILNTSGATKGLGSSPLAEGYANFSVFGVLALFLIGLIAGKLEIRAIVLRRSPAVFWYTLYCFVMVWSMRNDSLSWGRWFVWSYILWIGVVHLSKHLPGARRQGSEPSSYC